MIYKCIGIALMLFVLNCKATKHQTQMVEDAMVVIGKGNLFGAGQEGIEKQNLIITDIDQWNDLLKKVNVINPVSDSFTETEIDFTQFVVIAIFDSVKTTGGHDVALNIETLTDKIALQVISKGPEGMATSVMTQPFCIVKIPKSNLPLVFK